MEKNSEREIADLKNTGQVALRISINYVDGYTSLKILSEILKVQTCNPEKYISNFHFFNHLYGICYQSVIINLSNILMADKHNESINIYYLLSLLEKQLQDNRYSDEDKNIVSIINNITRTYSLQSSFYLGLKELRDKFIAHIDKKKFHSSTGTEQKISITEVRIAYDSIGELIDRLIYLFAINAELLDYELLEKASIQFQLMIDCIKSNS